MRGGWVYLITNKPFGPLYTGVTNDIRRRMHEHRERYGSRFASKYGLTRLVYHEWHEDILAAIQREANIKHWPRMWKLNLIEAANPCWKDLSGDLP